MDFFEYNYELDTLSAAQNSAALNIALQFPDDLNGNSRLPTITLILAPTKE